MCTFLLYSIFEDIFYALMQQPVVERIVAGTDLTIEFQGSVNEYVILPTEPLLLNFGPVAIKILS